MSWAPIGGQHVWQQTCPSTTASGRHAGWPGRTVQQQLVSGSGDSQVTPHPHWASSTRCEPSSTPRGPTQQADALTVYGRCGLQLVAVSQETTGSNAAATSSTNNSGSSSPDITSSSNWEGIAGLSAAPQQEQQEDEPEQQVSEAEARSSNPASTSGRPLPQAPPPWHTQQRYRLPRSSIRPPTSTNGRVQGSSGGNGWANTSSSSTANASSSSSSTSSSSGERLAQGSRGGRSTAASSLPAEVVLMQRIKQSRSWEQLAQLLQEAGPPPDSPQGQQPQQQQQQGLAAMGVRGLGGAWGMRHVTALLTHAAQLHQRNMPPQPQPPAAAAAAQHQQQQQPPPQPPAAAAAQPQQQPLQQDSPPPQGAGQGPLYRSAYRGFVSAAVQLLMSMLGEVDARGLANATWSLAVLQPVWTPPPHQLAALVAAAAPQLRAMDAQQLSNMAWALAQLGHPASPAWWEEFLVTWQGRLLAAAPQALSMCCCALVKVEVAVPQQLQAAMVARADALTAAAAEEAGAATDSSRRQSWGCGTQFVVNMVWVCACWQHAPGPHLLQQCHRWLKQQQQRREQQWMQDPSLQQAVAIVVWSMARLGCLEAPGAPATTTTSSSSSSGSRELSGGSARQQILDQQQQQQQQGQEVQLVCAAAGLAASAGRLHLFTNHSLSLLLWSAGTLHLPTTPAWQQEFLAVAAARSSSLTGQQVSNMLWGMLRLGWRPPAAWLQQLLMWQQVRLLPGRYSHRDASSVLLALAQLQYIPPAGFYTRVLQLVQPAPWGAAAGVPPPGASTAAAAAAAGGGPPPDVLLAVLCACATLRCPVPQAWLTACLTSCQDRLTALPVDQLARFGWAMAVLQSPPAREVQGGWYDAWAVAAAAGAEHMNPRSLALTLWAGSRHLQQQGQQQQAPPDFLNTSAATTNSSSSSRSSSEEGGGGRQHQSSTVSSSSSSVGVWAPAVEAAVALCRAGTSSVRTLVMLTLSICQLYDLTAATDHVAHPPPLHPGSDVLTNDMAVPHSMEGSPDNSSSSSGPQVPPSCRPLYASALRVLMAALLPRLPECSSRQLAQLLLLGARVGSPAPPGWCDTAARLLHGKLAQQQQELSAGGVGQQPAPGAAAGATAAAAAQGGAGRMAWVQDVTHALWAAAAAAASSSGTPPAQPPSSTLVSSSTSSSSRRRSGSSSVQQLVRWAVQQQGVVQAAAGPALLRWLWSLDRAAVPARIQTRLLHRFFASTSSPAALAARVPAEQLVSLSRVLVRCKARPPLPWRAAWRVCSLGLLSCSTPADTAALLWAAGRLRCCLVSRRRRKGRWMSAAAAAAAAALQAGHWDPQQAVQACGGLAACEAAQQLPGEALEVLVFRLAAVTRPVLFEMPARQLVVLLGAMVGLDPARAGLLPRQQVAFQAPSATGVQLPHGAGPAAGGGVAASGIPVEWLAAWQQATSVQLQEWPPGRVVAALHLLAAGGCRPAGAWLRPALAALTAALPSQQQQGRRRQQQQRRRQVLSVQQAAAVGRALALLESPLLEQWAVDAGAAFRPPGTYQSVLQRRRGWMAGVGVRRRARMQRRLERAQQRQQQQVLARQQGQQQRLAQLWDLQRQQQRRGLFRSLRPGGSTTGGVGSVLQQASTADSAASAALAAATAGGAGAGSKAAVLDAPLLPAAVANNVLAGSSYGNGRVLARRPAVTARGSQLLPVNGQLPAAVEPAGVDGNSEVVKQTATANS